MFSHVMEGNWQTPTDISAINPYKNQIRFYDLCSRLFRQDANLRDALFEIEQLKAFVGSPEHILGSSLTKHGEIAEHVQVNISNARNAIWGLDKEYTFDNVARLAPEDYLKNGLPVQSKFCNGLKLTLRAIQEHNKTYPTFIPDGGSYDIPKDQWEEMLDIINRKKYQPSSLSKSDYSKYQAIEKFQKETRLSIETDVHPSIAEYKQVQQTIVHKTIDREEKSIRHEDEKQREIAQKQTAPNIKEGSGIAAKGAAVEGGITFCFAVYDKMRTGKRLYEFTGDDWVDIAKKTGFGAIKGSVRGTSVYLLTNFTKTSANLASAYTAAVFGVASQVAALYRGEITNDDFLINSEIMCLDIAVSTISTYLGQVAIPIPILGGLIGNIIGETLYGIYQKYADEYEQKLIAQHISKLEEYEASLDETYNEFIAMINDHIQRFPDICALSFDCDTNIAFTNSIQLARYIGVPEERILKSTADIDAFFMG